MSHILDWIEDIGGTDLLPYRPLRIIINYKEIEKSFQSQLLLPNRWPLAKC